MKRRWAFWATFLSVFLTGPSFSDTLTKKDGTELRGRIVSETQSEVAIEVRMDGGGKATVKVSRGDIRSMVRQEAKGSPRETTSQEAPRSTSDGGGPGYYAIPIIGEIGVEVRADILKRALADVSQKKPDVLILHFDSPGGSVAEAERILAVLAGIKGVRLVAHVRRALSAAAVIAMACPEICMTRDGTIGAAVPYRIGPNGTPQVVEEKFQSAIRAASRSAAEMGGHSALIIEGMMNADLQLGIKIAEGKPTVVKGQGDKALKAKGKILTLTPKEAVACGLAKGVADTVDSVKDPLGLKEWHLVKGGGWSFMERQAAKGRKTEQREGYLASIAPQLAKIDAKLAEVRASGKVAEVAKSSLQRQYNAEVAEANEAYEADLNTASLTADLARKRSLQQRAHEKLDQRMAAIKSLYRPQAAGIKAKISRFYQEQNRLLQARRDLLGADASMKGRP